MTDLARCVSHPDRPCRVLTHLCAACPCRGIHNPNLHLIYRYAHERGLNPNDVIEEITR